MKCQSKIPADDSIDALRKGQMGQPPALLVAIRGHSALGPPAFRVNARGRARIEAAPGSGMPCRFVVRPFSSRERLVRAVPLIMIGLGIAIAFRGQCPQTSVAEGQFFYSAGAIRRRVDGLHLGRRERSQRRPQEFPGGVGHSGWTLPRDAMDRAAGLAKAPVRPCWR
jgi:hypothetical protein